MEFLKTLTLIVYIIVCFALIILALIQTSKTGGASGAIMGGSTSSFYEKNKGRTKEGKLKRWTIIIGIIFILLTIVEGILYML